MLTGHVTALGSHLFLIIQSISCLYSLKGKVNKQYNSLTFHISALFDTKQDDNTTIISRQSLVPEKNSNCEIVLRDKENIQHHVKPFLNGSKIYRGSKVHQ